MGGGQDKPTLEGSPPAPSLLQHGPEASAPLQPLLLYPLLIRIGSTAGNKALCDAQSLAKPQNELPQAPSITPPTLEPQQSSHEI